MFVNKATIKLWSLLLLLFCALTPPTRSQSTEKELDGGGVIEVGVSPMRHLTANRSVRGVNRMTSKRRLPSTPESVLAQPSEIRTCNTTTLLSFLCVFTCADPPVDHLRRLTLMESCPAALTDL